MKTLDTLKKLGCCAITILLFLLTNASFAQTLTTDKSDYAPGTTCTLTGSGFAAGEEVSLQVLHADGTPDTGEDHDAWPITAGDDGGFTATWHVCTDDCVGALLRATADQASGAHAEVLFTDNFALDFSQAENGIISDNFPIDWINGILNAVHST